MIDVPMFTNWLLNGARTIHRYGFPDRAMDPSLAAAAAVLLGFVTAFWGARLFRLAFMLGLMAVGGWLGVRLSRRVEIELLIGLVFGVGLFGLVGYFFYRVWVGLTAAMVAVLVMAAIGAPWLWDDVATCAQEHQQGSPAWATEVASAGPGSHVPTGGEPRPALGRWAFIKATSARLWKDRHAELARLGWLAAVGAGLGLLLGIVLPRLTAILVTAVLGVMVAVAGVSELLARHQPNWYATATANQRIVLAGLGLCLLVAIVFQRQHGKIPLPPPAPPAEPPARTA